MRRALHFALILILISPITLTSVANGEDRQPRKIVSGWIPYYSVKSVMPFIKKLPTLPLPASGSPVTCEDNEYSAEDLATLNASYLYSNKDLMKEVMPFWYTLKSSTVIRDDYATANPSWPMADTLCLMKKTGLKIIPTITDGTDKLVLANYLSNEKNRKSIVKAIVDLVNKNSFDGIDLDFEGFAFVDGNNTWSKTAPNWITFVKELSVALHAQQKILSITSPYAYDPADKIKGYTVYSWAAIASDIDRLRIMTYDYSVAKPGPIGPITWVEKTVKYAASIMPSTKVFLGLPGYGRDWITSITGTCPVTAPPGLKAGSKAATFKTSYANTKAQIDKATPTFDTAASEVTYKYVQSFNGVTTKGAATSCSATRTVWYQNDRSYLERMNLVAQYNLGGSALWTLGMEDVSATNAMRSVAVSIGPEKVITTLSLSNDIDQSIYYGGVFTLKGLLTLVDKTPISGLSATLQMKHDGENSWVDLAQLVSGQDGSVSVPVRIARSAQFRLVTSESDSYADSMSDEVNVILLSRVIVDRPATVKRLTPIVIKGFLLPQVSSQNVSVQKYTSGKWQNVGLSTVTADDGSFVASVTERNKGVVTLRIVVTLNTQQINSSQFSVVVR